MPAKICIILILLLGISAIIFAQFSIPTLFEADGYLHIRMANFIRQYGLKYDFHWARYSTFAQHFSDKDLLYHLLILPFTFLSDIFLGAKIASCIFAILLYLAFFLLLRRYCSKPLIPVFLVTLLLSPPFLEAMSRTRPMIFMIALTLAFVHFLIERRQWPLFILTVIYTLSHVSSPLLLVFVLLAEVTRFIAEGSFSGKSVQTVILGLVIGFLIHPNFPNNFLVFYLNGILVPIFALKWGLELGAEFFPTDTRDFVLGYPFILIGLVLLIALGTSRTNKINTSTKIWMSISGFFFIFSFFSRRYIIHSYPLILISLAAYISDWWASVERLWPIRQHKALKVGLVACALLVFTLIGVHTYKEFRKVAFGEMQYNLHYEAVAKWMSRYIPAGEVVFHANWSDSQYFIGLNPQNDYFVTFDPIYMYYWNPQKYKLYREIAFGQAKDPYALLKKEFGVNFGYAGKNYFSGLINQVRLDSRFAVLAEDNLGLIFRLK